MARPGGQNDLAWRGRFKKAITDGVATIMFRLAFSARLDHVDRMIWPGKVGSKSHHRWRFNMNRMILFGEVGAKKPSQMALQQLCLD
jgi:hypothetical protein